MPVYTYKQKHDILQKKNFDEIGCSVSINKWIREKDIIYAAVEIGYGNKGKLVSPLTWYVLVYICVSFFFILPRFILERRGKRRGAPKGK